MAAPAARTTLGMKKTTTMTSQDPDERRAAMAARVHRLSDPLAAMGQRSRGAQIRRERNARLALLIITLSATVAITGTVAIVAEQPSGDDTAAVAQQVPGQAVHIRTKST